MQIINCFEAANTEQNVLLNGVPFNINLYYNVRDEAWYINIYTNENKEIIVGKKLIINTNVLDQVFLEEKPKGVLLVLSLTNVLEITRDNLGTDVELIFISENEIF